MKDLQVSKRSPQPSFQLQENKEHGKLRNFFTFSYFTGHFCPLWSGSALKPIRIRIQVTKINEDPCGSASTKLVTIHDDKRRPLKWNGKYARRTIHLVCVRILHLEDPLVLLVGHELYGGVGHNARHCRGIPAPQREESCIRTRVGD